MKKVDKIFSEKLQRLEATPSSDAWNQIQIGLEEEKKPIHWAFVAASIGLLLVAGTFLWTQQVQIEAPGEQVVAQFEIAAPSIERIETQPARTATSSNEKIIAETETQNQQALPMKTSLETRSGNPLLIAESQISIQVKGAHVDYITSSLELNFYPMYVEDAKNDESKFKRAWEYAQRVKNGETKPLNLRKAKDDLFAFAKSKIKSEDNTPLNFD
jgi:hypothetical protein